MNEKENQKEPRYNLEQKKELRRIWAKGIAIIFVSGWIFLLVAFIFSVV